MKTIKFKIPNHLHSIIIFGILIIYSSCGFQGRKYTTGHYWDGRNEIEYDKQNEKQNGNGNEEVNPKKKEKESAIHQRNESEEKLSSKVDEINSAIKLAEDQKFIVPYTSSRTNNLEPNSGKGNLLSIDPNDIVLETDTVPQSLLNKHKSINRQIFWGLVIASFSFDIFGSIIGLGVNEPDLIFIPILALCIFPFIFVPQLKKLMISINKFKEELERSKSTNAEKAWFKKESRYLYNIDSLRFFILWGTIALTALSLLLINTFFAGG